MEPGRLILQSTSYTLNPFCLPPLAVAVSCLLLGLIILSRGRNPVSVVFMILSTCLTVWFLAFTMMYASTRREVALVYARAAYLGVPFIPAAALHLMTETFPPVQMRRVRSVSIAWIVSGVFSVLAIGTEHLIADAAVFWWGYYVRYGWLSVPFIAFFVGTVALAYGHGRRECRRIPNRRGEQYRRGQVILLAYLIAGLGMVDFLPKFGLPLYPFGYLPFCVFLFVLFRNVSKTGLTPISPSYAADSIIAILSDGLVLFDAEGIVRFANPAFCALFGLEQRQVQDQALQAVCSRIPDAPSLISAMQAGPLKDRELAFGEGRDRRVLSISSSLLPGPGGHLGGTVCITRDVTDRRHLEEQLQQAQKMESIGRLAGGLAHDFNNLLTSILGYGELLQEAGGLEEAQREYIGEIQRAARRAAALTGQLLAFSRKQIHHPRVLDINALLLNMQRLLRPLIPENIGLSYDLAEQAGNIKADPGQLEQIVLNLVVNAVDAMENGGRLRIATACADRSEILPDRKLEIPQAQYVLIRVEDDGHGIAPAILDKVFEPFFTTKAQGKGTGLGLSMVYGIVKQSGGFVDVESQPGKGSAFRVYLPRVNEEACPPNLEREAPQPALQGGGRILFVEDEDSLRRMLCDYLVRCGYQVAEAGDGRTALERFRGRGAEFDLLVTDVVMPGLGGEELAAALVAENPALQVLHISGYAESSLAPEGLLPPGVRLLQKPFSPRRLEAEIRTILGSAAPEN